MKDVEVLEWASTERRIVVTDDKDFGELTVRRGLRSAGIVLFRLESEDEAVRVAKLMEAIASLGESLYGSFTVIRLGTSSSSKMSSRFAISAAPNLGGGV